MQTPVEQHYSLPHLFENIIAALEKAGVDKSKITRKELAATDEFHVRGLEVTKELASHAGLQQDMKILDVGCGVGGPCRLLADEYGCFTTGIDITQEYIRTATLLSELTGLQDRTNFIQADALQLPFENNRFDRVWTQHVQMNIENKKKFYAEISRVLKPGGKFIYYDIFSINNEVIHFPVPWAEMASISYLVTTDELHNILGTSGLDIIETTDQTAPGINFIAAMIDRMKNQDAPPVSLKLIMGDSVGEKLGNLYQNLIEKKIRLESGVCRKK
ncbi:MAG: class I SAM-dependent methyltransferase [Bacteroidota bacterium]